MPDAESIRSWCRRGTSLGADGLIVLSRAATGGGRARLRMAYFNADGGRADLCGNGSRCAALLVFELAWSRDRLDLETDVGVLAAHRLAEDRVRVDVPDPAEPARRLDLDETPARLETGLPVHGWWLTVGVPHLVLLLGEDSIRLDRLDIADHATTPLSATPAPTSISSGPWTTCSSCAPGNAASRARPSPAARARSRRRWSPRSWASQGCRAQCACAVARCCASAAASSPQARAESQGRARCGRRDLRR